MNFLTPAKVTIAMLGVVGLLVGGYFVKSMLATEEKAPEVQTQNVPMAVADIPAGTLITAAHLAQGPILKEKLNEYKDIVRNDRVIVNRIAKEPIKAATAIRSTQLYAPGEFPSLDVSPGMRAVSLSMGDTTQLVSGLLKPGQFADIHLTPSGVPNDERTGGGMTMTLMKGVKILAINRGTRTPGAADRQGNQVTFEVSPRQSNILILAKGKGDLTMTYNPEVTESARPGDGNEDRATYHEILGLDPLPKPEPPTIIENYRASGRSLMTFRDGKHIDVYQIQNPQYGSAGGYGGYGAASGSGYATYGLGAFDAGGLRPPPVNFNYFWQSYQGNGDTRAGNGPAPTAIPPAYGPSAQNSQTRL